MDEQFRSRLVQRDLRELYPPSKQRRWLWFEIVVGRIPKHLDAMFHSQSGVVELDLHVDDMRDACARHVRHIIRRPDPASDRNSASQPGNIHSLPVGSGQSCPSQYLQRSHKPAVGTIFP